MSLNQAAPNIRTITERITQALAEGDHRPLLEALAADVAWRWMGVSAWSRTFEGREAVINELFGGVDDELASSGTSRLDHLYIDGNTAVVEHSGSNQTPDGRRYDNNYCWILNFKSGQIVEVREYMDTHLVNETFADDPS